MNSSSSAPIDFSKSEKWHDLFYGVAPPKLFQLFKRFLANRDQLVRLYHGTAANLPIMEQGLLPTSARRRRSLQSTSGYVYLSVYPGAAKDFGRMGNSGRAIEVYKVEIPIRILLADKDQLNNKRYWGEDSTIGNDLASSLMIGHGARVKGRIPHGSFAQPSARSIRIGSNPSPRPA